MPAKPVEPTGKQPALQPRCMLGWAALNPGLGEANELQMCRFQLSL